MTEATRNKKPDAGAGFRRRKRHGSALRLLPCSREVAVGHIDGRDQGLQICVSQNDRRQRNDGEVRQFIAGNLLDFLELRGALSLIALNGSGTEKVIHLWIVIMRRVDIRCRVLDAIGPVEPLYASCRVEQAADAVYGQIEAALGVDTLDESREIAVKRFHLDPGLPNDERRYSEVLRKTSDGRKARRSENRVPSAPFG